MGEHRKLEGLILQMETTAKADVAKAGCVGEAPPSARAEQTLSTAPLGRDKVGKSCQTKE